MTDVGTIAAALSSLKTAAEIVKFLRETDLSLERAELRLKLADLVGALADAKHEVFEVQELLTAKDARIAELEESFAKRDTLTRRYDAYYVVDGEGNPSGEAFCLRCWENDHKVRQLVYLAKDRFTKVCTSCGHQYEARRASAVAPPAHG